MAGGNPRLSVEGRSRIGYGVPCCSFGHRRIDDTAAGRRTPTPTDVRQPYPLLAQLSTRRVCVSSREDRGRYRGRRRAPAPPRTRYAAVGLTAFVGAGVVALGTQVALPG